MANQIDLRLLRYFVTVAEERNITRAAERLGIAQPPLSQQMRLLEKRLGVGLLDRHRTGVSLTRAGQALLERAQELLASTDSLVPYVRQAARGRYRTLRIGMTTSVALHPLTSDILHHSASKHDDLFLDLHDHNAKTLTEQLIDGKLDVVMLRTKVANTKVLMSLVVDQEPVLMTLDSEHPLCKRMSKERRKSLSLSDVKDEKFILVRAPGQPGLYEQFVRLCRRKGFEPNIAAETPRMLSCLNMVAAGMGISIVPASMQSVLSHRIRYMACDDLKDLSAPLTILHRRKDERPIIRDFMKEAMSVAQQGAKSLK